MAMLIRSTPKKSRKMLKDKFLPVPSASLLPERSNVMSKKWECVRSKRRSSIKEHYTSVVQSFNFFHFSFFSFFFFSFQWHSLHKLGPLCQNHLSWQPGEWATPWSAEEMLVGQCQRVDTTAHTRTAQNGFPQKRLEEDLC